MCGHTFCNECVSALAELGGTHQNGYKNQLVCPIDRLSIDLPNPNYEFPKNLVLLELAKKKH